MRGAEEQPVINAPPVVKYHVAYKMAGVDDVKRLILLPANHSTAKTPKAVIPHYSCHTPSLVGQVSPTEWMFVSSHIHVP